VCSGGVFLFGEFVGEAFRFFPNLDFGLAREREGCLDFWTGSLSLRDDKFALSVAAFVLLAAGSVAAAVFVAVAGGVVDAGGGLMGVAILGVGVGAVAGGLLLLAIMMRDADKFDGVGGRRSGGGGAAEAEFVG
jgi:hypothetical protein